MPVSPGTLIGSNIRLVRLLGEGGMGSVWIADHLTLNNQVAVKFMAPELILQDSALERFSREAMAAAAIKSPHVVQVFDHGFTPERVPYIVMELLEGQDLSRLLHDRGRLDLDETARIVTQVCKALSRAHALGIVHRDIKPENIFLCDVEGDVFVKVLDFGIAKREKDQGFSVTKSGAMVGTPYYMSPEQVLKAKAVDFRSDLWSLAVVAYNCLTGTRPFDGETLGGIVVAIDRGTYMAPSRFAPALAPAVDVWFARALQRNPASRFQTAKEMAEALWAAVRALAAVPRVSTGMEKTEPLPLGGMPTMNTPHPTVDGVRAVSDRASAPAGMSAGTFPGTEVTEPQRRRSRAPVVVATIAGIAVTAGVVGLALLAFRASNDAQPGAAASTPVESSTATAAGTETAPPIVAPPATQTATAAPVATASATATAASVATASATTVRPSTPTIPGSKPRPKPDKPVALPPNKDPNPHGIE